ncbi:MAG: hypothetical protein AB7G39_12230 [Alphaproteobacteria bacterium]
MNLATLYRDGQGVGKDAGEAYFWFSLAAKENRSGADKQRDQIAAQLPPAQLAEMNKRLSEWKPSSGISEGKDG